MQYFSKLLWNGRSYFVETEWKLLDINELLVFLRSWTWCRSGTVNFPGCKTTGVGSCTKWSWWRSQCELSFLWYAFGWLMLFMIESYWFKDGYISLYSCPSKGFKECDQSNYMHTLYVLQWWCQWSFIEGGGAESQWNIYSGVVIIKLPDVYLFCWHVQQYICWFIFHLLS